MIAQKIYLRKYKSQDPLIPPLCYYLTNKYQKNLFYKVHTLKLTAFIYSCFTTLFYEFLDLFSVF